MKRDLQLAVGAAAVTLVPGIDFPDLHFRMVQVGRGLFGAAVQKSVLDLLPE